ncbi:MAG: HDIG domain-containing protein [Chitinivibrionales bacterium]|nr:HDIG domain-containing protein [Chitinivibrionales bacterium]
MNMARDSNNKKKSTSSKDTTSVMVVRITRGISVRLPRFITLPLIILLCSIAATVLLFPYHSTVRTFDLPKLGEVAKETIISPVTFDILKSKTELEAERREAMNQVLLVLNYRDDVRERVQRKFLDLRAAILTLNEGETPDSAKAPLRSTLKKELSDNTIRALLKRPYLLDDALFQAEQALEAGISSVTLVQSEQALSELRDQYNSSFDGYLVYDKDYVTVVRDSQEITVKVSDIPSKPIVLDNIVRTLRVERMFDQEALNSLYEILDAYIIPNLAIDGEETARRRRQASREILPIKGKVIKDTEIVRKHQEVTPDILQKLTSLHAALQKHDQGNGRAGRILSANVGEVLLVVIPLIFLGFFIRGYHPELMKKPKHLTALASIIVLQLALIRLGLLIVPKLFEGSREMTSVVPEYLIPTAVAAMLITLLFDTQLSVITTVVISIFFGVVLSFSHPLFMFSLFGGIAAAFAGRGIRYRWDFFRAMVPISLAYFLFVTIWHLISFKFVWLEIVQNLGLSLINVIATTILAMMFVTVFENVFGIVTDMTLVELSDMNHPLLKKLSIEAAGTYNHSVLVANLAESAAERINANSLLARVASYYHDIGKMAKPHYFIENQKADKNVHNKLNPSMSALIISSHVKEGLELGKRHKLPPAIQSAIEQHHGTSTVSFFFEKALEQDPHKQIQEKDFCYPGPRPQTKENAIIMLADSVEAASRSLAASSPKLLRELVKKIIHDKFASSQLDECDLTFQDLDRIIHGFMPVLEGIFHTRIEYPNKK